MKRELKLTYIGLIWINGLLSYLWRPKLISRSIRQWHLSFKSWKKKVKRGANNLCHLPWLILQLISFMLIQILTWFLILLALTIGKGKVMLEKPKASLGLLSSCESTWYLKCAQKISIDARGDGNSLGMGIKCKKILEVHLPRQWLIHHLMLVEFMEEG